MVGMKHMAKNQAYNLDRIRKERIAFGMLIILLGCAWLAAEVGMIKTTLPIGPIVAIIIGFAMFLPWIRQ